MSLNSTDIQKIARLARLKINETEQAVYLDQLTQTFNLLDRLKSVDTSHTPEVNKNPLPLRADVISEPDQRALFQSIAPKTEAGLYLVPQVIE